MSLLLNIDAGEHEPGWAGDLAFLEVVDAVNLALGGHAGDPGWTRELAAEAEFRGVRVHLHPSYPDRENFGRYIMQMDWRDLSASLTEQRSVLPDCTVCKPHGALYNEAARDPELAARLSDWCLRQGIDEVLCSPGSAFAQAASSAGLRVLREGFADRAYVRDRDGSVVLAPRSQTGAVLDSVEAALVQAYHISTEGKVALLSGGEAELQCDTICLHGDAVSALELATRLRELLG